MRRGTTPTLKVAVSGIDISLLSTVYITIKQSDMEIEKSGTAILRIVEDNAFETTLTQEDTLALVTCNSVYLQIRAKTTNGAAIASNIVKVKVDDILKEGVI